MMFTIKVVSGINSSQCSDASSELILLMYNVNVKLPNKCFRTDRKDENRNSVFYVPEHKHLFSMPEKRNL